jgi:hypothetical protein
MVKKGKNIYVFRLFAQNPPKEDKFSKQNYIIALIQRQKKAE